MSLSFVYLSPPETAQRNVLRADQALNSDIPKLRDELQDSLVILQDLSTTLPRIRSRVANIRHAYDSGRTKVSNESDRTFSSINAFLGARARLQFDVAEHRLS